MFRKRTVLFIGAILAIALSLFLQDPGRYLPIRSITFVDSDFEKNRYDSPFYAYKPSPEDHWDLTDVQELNSRFCNIERRSMWSLTREAFEKKYLEALPVIIVIDEDAELERHELFQTLTTRASMLKRFGNYTITLSSANRNSYAKKHVMLHEYLERKGDMKGFMAPQPLERKGEDTWYMFGDQNAEEWSVLFTHYPSLRRYIFGKYTSLSFGIGPSGSGVPFHTHGHVFNEVLHGRKRWWLQRPDRLDETSKTPDDGPLQDPQASTLQWLHTIRPHYDKGAADALWECTVGPGEVLYIPSQWHHATLNVGETVFMAAFV